MASSEEISFNSESHYQWYNSDYSLNYWHSSPVNNNQSNHQHYPTSYYHRSASPELLNDTNRTNETYNSSYSQYFNNNTAAQYPYYSNYSYYNYNNNNNNSAGYSSYNSQESEDNVYNWDMYNYWKQQSNYQVSSSVDEISLKQDDVFRLNERNDDESDNNSIANEFNKKILPLLLNDEDNKRKGRTAFTSDQRLYLLSLFEQNCYPTKEVLEMAARKLQVTSQVIQTWFKNTRSKRKKLTNTKNL